MTRVTAPRLLRLLAAGWIVLPCGESAEALGLTPPLILSDAAADGFVAALSDAISAPTTGC